MSAAFVSRSVGPWSVLAHERLAGGPATHGFIGSDLDFSEAKFALSAGHLCEALGRKALIVPRQVHGSSFLELSREVLPVLASTPRRELQEADALLIPGGIGGGYLFGVRTADCLPVILRAGDVFGLVHAGWRGLAANVLSKVGTRMRAMTGAPIEAVIGPAAGADSYEVGPEVVKAIGARAVFRSSEGPGEKYLLSLAATAEAELVELGGSVTVGVADRCTISSPAWHSFRRHGPGVGSNLAFLAP